MILYTYFLFFGFIRLIYNYFLVKVAILAYYKDKIFLTLEIINLFKVSIDILTVKVINLFKIFINK